MAASLCFWSKIVTLALCCLLNGFLFYNSLGVSYQWLLARERTRFRLDAPSIDDWINSPDGKLRSYLFNVTNEEAFLNGTDSKLKIEEVGPIVYKLLGRNEIIERTPSSLTYRKNRYHKIQFLPDESPPNIFNQTITLPNFILLGTAAKFNDWSPFVRPVFNAFTVSEKVFLTNSVYFFLWEFTTPGLNVISKFDDTVAANCGMLYNALKQKPELYDLKIGPDVTTFFELNTLNNRTSFEKEHPDRKKYLEPNSNLYCPLEVDSTFDNSLFPPFLTPERKLKIVAIEACRSLPMHYQRTVIKYDSGLDVFRYTIEERSERPSCLDTTYGMPLPKGMFDISPCIVNKAPTALSNPHFLNSGYNWSEHFEGFKPNVDDHEPFIAIEPISGVPIKERYRFQSNVPMPSMAGFSPKLQKFNGMILPMFWYEFETVDLSTLSKALIRFNAKVLPILQPIIMALFVFFGMLCLLKIVLIFKGVTMWGLISQRLGIGGASNAKLETTFPQNAVEDVLQLEKQ